MKRFILAAAVTMLALAGAAAAAQDHSGSPVYGVEPPQTSAGYLGAAATPRAMAPALDSKQRAKLTTALHGYQMSCQPDRETLCADKHGRIIDECLVYHRLRLSTPCKQAMDTVVLAQRGAL